MHVTKLPSVFSLCQLCQKTLSPSANSYKCPRCKMLMCTSCSASSYKHSGSDSCPSCEEDTSFIDQFHTDYQPFWNHNSTLALKWLNSCHVLTELNNITQDDYKQYLASFDASPQFKDIAEELSNDIHQGKADPENFNYSFAQFIRSVQVKKDRAEARASVERVLKAYYARHSDYGYNPLLIGVATLLLCLADEETAFSLLNYISEKLLPTDFWNSFSGIIPYLGLLKREYVLYKTFLSSEIPNAKNHKAFQVLYNKVIHVLLGGLAVDMTNISTTMSIWDDLLTQGSFRALESNIMKILKCSWERFENKVSSTSLYEFRLFGLRVIQPKRLIKTSSIPLSAEDEQKLLDEFEDTVLDQVILAKKELTDALEVFKDLNENELRLALTKLTQLGEQAQKENSTMIHEETFISALIDIPAFKTHGEKGLAEVFQALDIYREETISVPILNGILTLCTGGDLELRLGRFFDLFDPASEGIVNAERAISAINLLQKVLYIVNEANSGYINFSMNVCEMTGKLMKRMIKEEQVTRETFQRLTAKYPALQALPGILSKHIRRVGSTDSFISIDDNESPLEYQIINEIDFNELDSPTIISDKSRASPEPLSVRKSPSISPLIVKSENLSLKKGKSEDGAYIIDNLSIESPAKTPEKQTYEVVKDEEVDLNIIKKETEVIESIEIRSPTSAAIIISSGDRSSDKNQSMEAVVGEAEELLRKREEEVESEIGGEGQIIEAAELREALERSLTKNDADVGIVKDNSAKGGSGSGSSSGPDSEPDTEAAVEQAALRDSLTIPEPRMTEPERRAEIPHPQIEVELSNSNKLIAVAPVIEERSRAKEVDDKKVRAQDQSVSIERKMTMNSSTELRDDAGMGQAPNRNMIRSEIKVVKGGAPPRRPVRRVREREDECVLCNIF